MDINDHPYDSDEEEDHLQASEELNASTRFAHRTGTNATPQISSGQTVGYKVPCNFAFLSQMIMDLLRSKFAFRGTGGGGDITVLRALRCVLSLGNPNGSTLYAMDDDNDDIDTSIASRRARSKTDFAEVQEEVNEVPDCFVREWGHNLLQRTEFSDEALLFTSERDTESLQRELYALLRHYWNECPLHYAHGDPLWQMLWKPLHSERRLRKTYLEAEKSFHEPRRKPQTYEEKLHDKKIRMQRKAKLGQLGQHNVSATDRIMRNVPRRPGQQTTRYFSDGKRDPYKCPFDRMYFVFSSLVRGEPLERNGNWWKWIMETLLPTVCKRPDGATDYLWKVYWSRIENSMHRRKERTGRRVVTVVDVPEIISMFAEDAEKSFALMRRAAQQNKDTKDSSARMSENLGYLYALSMVRADPDDTLIDKPIVQLINRGHFRRGHGIWVQPDLDRVQNLWLRYVRDLYPDLVGTMRQYFDHPTADLLPSTNPGDPTVRLTPRAPVAPKHLFLFMAMASFMELGHVAKGTRELTIPKAHEWAARRIVQRACMLDRLWDWFDLLPSWIDIMTTNPGKRLATLYFTYGQQGWTLHHARNVIAPMREELHRFARGTTNARLTPYTFPLSIHVLRSLRESLRPYVKKYLAPTRRDVPPKPQECPPSFGTLPVRLGTTNGSVYRRVLSAEQEARRKDQQTRASMGVHSYDSASSGGGSSGLSSSDSADEEIYLGSIHRVTPIERLGILLCSLPDSVLGFIALVNTNLQLRMRKTLVNHPWGVISCPHLQKILQVESRSSRRWYYPLQELEPFDGNRNEQYSVAVNLESHITYVTTKPSTRLLMPRTAWERLFMDTQQHLHTVPQEFRLSHVPQSAQRSCEWLRLSLCAEEMLFGERVCAVEPGQMPQLTMTHLCQGRDEACTLYPAIKNSKFVRDLIGPEEIVPLGGRLFVEVEDDVLDGKSYRLRTTTTQRSPANNVWPVVVPGSTTERPWRLLDSSSSGKVIGKLFRERLFRYFNELVTTVHRSHVNVYRDLKQFMDMSVFLMVPFWTHDSVFGQYLLRRAELMDISASNVVRMAEMMSSYAWNHYLYQKSAPRVTSVPTKTVRDDRPHADDLWVRQKKHATAHREIVGVMGGAKAVQDGDHCLDTIHMRDDQSSLPPPLPPPPPTSSSSSTASAAQPNEPMPLSTSRNLSMETVLRRSERGDFLHTIAEQLRTLDNNLQGRVSEKCEDTAQWFMRNFWNRRNMHNALRGACVTEMSEAYSRADQSRRNVLGIKGNGTDDLIVSATWVKRIARHVGESGVDDYDLTQLQIADELATFNAAREGNRRKRSRKAMAQRDEEKEEQEEGGGGDEEDDNGRTFSGKRHCSRQKRKTQL